MGMGLLALGLYLRSCGRLKYSPQSLPFLHPCPSLYNFAIPPTEVRVYFPYGDQLSWFSMDVAFNTKTKKVTSILGWASQCNELSQILPLGLTI